VFPEAIEKACPASMYVPANDTVFPFGFLTRSSNVITFDVSTFEKSNPIVVFAPIVTSYMLAF